MHTCCPGKLCAFSQRPVGAFAKQDCSEIPVMGASAGCLATPARASPPRPGARLLPLHPVAMGTSTLRLAEQLARCLIFSIRGLTSLSSRAPLGLSLEVKAVCLFRRKWRLPCPRAPGCQPWSCGPPPRGQPARCTLCPHFEQATGPLSCMKQPRETQGMCQGAQPVLGVSVSPPILPVPERQRLSGYGDPRP